MTKRIDIELRANDHASAEVKQFGATVKQVQDVLQRELQETANAYRKADAADDKFRRSATAAMARPSFTGAMGTASQVAGMAGFGGIAGMVGVGTIGALQARAMREVVDGVSTSFNELDALAKRSDKLGVLPRELQRLEYAAGQSGVETDLLTKSMQKYVKYAGDAEDGNKKAAATFSRLGLNVRELRKLDLPGEMLAVADALQKVGNSDDQLRMATTLFGGRGADMLNVLKGGSGGVRASLERFTDIRGDGPSRADVAKVEGAMDAIDDVKVALKGLADEAAYTLAPAVKGAADEITETFIALRKWRDSLPDRATGSVEEREQKLRRDMAEAGMHRGDVGLLDVVTRPDLAGRAFGLNREKELMDKTNRLGRAPIDIEAENAKRGLTPERLAEIGAKQEEFNQRMRENLAPAIAADAEKKRHEEAIGWLRGRIKGRSDAAGEKLAGAADELWRAIPRSVREGAADLFKPIADGAPSLKALALDLQSQVKGEDGTLVENKDQGNLTRDWVKGWLPDMTRDVLGAIPKAAGEAIAKVKVPESFGDDPEVRKLREMMRTPDEIFAAEMAHLEDMRKRGLDDATFERANKAALERRDGGMGREPREGMHEGLQAFVSRTLSRGSGQVDPALTAQQETAKFSRQQVREGQRAVEELKRLSRAVERLTSFGGPPVAGAT